MCSWHRKYLTSTARRAGCRKGTADSRFSCWQDSNAHFRGRWDAHGNVIFGVALNNVSYTNINNTKREITLRLPHPHVIQGKVDHQRSREISMEKRVLIPLSSEKALRDEVWAEADAKIERVAREQPSYADLAKAQAERVLGNLFESVGWTASFEWEDNGQVTAQR
jgi:Protein of unknown function (DUF4230)